MTASETLKQLKALGSAKVRAQNAKWQTPIPTCSGR
jgi:hypothetical protein